MAGSRVYLDTNGWLALLNSSDSLHPAAKAAWVALGQRGYSVFVTDLVIAEMGNGLARTPARRSFRAAVESLESSARCRVIPASGGLLRRALDLYHDHADKT